VGLGLVPVTGVRGPGGPAGVSPAGRVEGVGDTVASRVSRVSVGQRDWSSAIAAAPVAVAKSAPAASTEPPPGPSGAECRPPVVMA
jgi:hypothetical protein